MPCHAMPFAPVVAGERIGALHVVASSQKEAQAVQSQLEVIVRPMYSVRPLASVSLLLCFLGCNLTALPLP